MVAQVGQQTEETDIVDFVMKADFHAHQVPLQENRIIMWSQWYTNVTQQKHLKVH